MKVTAEKEKRYKLTVDNRSVYMGQYYAEDDWSIEVYGKNDIELALALKNHYRYEELGYNGGCLEEIEVLIYEGNIFDLDMVSSIKYPESSKRTKKIYEMTKLSNKELKQKLREKKIERILK
jgi:hypothetical protein